MKYNSIDEGKITPTISSLLHYLFLTSEFHRKRKQTTCKDQNLEMPTSFLHLEVVDTPHAIFSRYTWGVLSCFCNAIFIRTFSFGQKGHFKTNNLGFFHSSEWM